MTPVVCSVGTGDPWNAAGIGFDVRALEWLGVRPVTVIAGVSAQGASGISSLRAIGADVLASQFAALRGAGIAAYRIGALLDAASVEAVANEVGLRLAPAVYDPVLGASAGGVFADAATQRSMCERLLPEVAILTPNVAEARALAGLAAADALRAAHALVRMGARAALVTGTAEGDEIADYLVDAAGERRFAAARIDGDMRGTGCLLACGIAASLARGHALRDAIPHAREFVRERIRDAQTIGGMRVMRLRT
jgi:hydroxymethylpyrimidine kinase/phosphomethylpyrimidine kinase